MLRYFFLNAFVGIQTIIFSIWSLMISVVDRTGRWVHFYGARPWARSILWVCGVRVKVEGLDNVDSGLPRIYMTNHQSFFDIFVLLSCLPVDFKFILKRELTRIPILGPAMKRAGYISIDRDDPRKAVKSMEQAADRIRAGASVLIFPEGTRSQDGSLQPFKKGGFHLALKSGCDIVPVSIVNTHRIAEKGSLRINRGDVSMIVGKAIPVSEYSKRDMAGLMTRVRDAMISGLGGDSK